MKIERISQKKLINIAKKEGIKITDRMVNYYINLNLLPKPVKTIDKSVSDSDKAQNLFDYKHTVFMLEILKKKKLFGFSKISQMKNILSGGRYTLYEELMFLKYYIYDQDYNLDYNSVLVVSSGSVRANNRIFSDIAKHVVIEPNDVEHSDFPFFPNYDLWHCAAHKREYKEEYRWTVEWRSKKDYFEIKIPSNKEFDPKEFIDENFTSLYFKEEG